MKCIIYLVMILIVFSGLSAIKYIPICYLHRITNVSDNGYFNQFMKYLNDSGYTTITIEQYGLIREGKMESPKKPIILNFDDGRKEIIERAYPIMAKYGYVGVIAYPVKATWFNPKMNSSDLKFLISQGWEVGSHGWEGQNLYTYYKGDMNKIYKELNQSKYEIGLMTGVEPEYYVFPENGANQTIMDMCLKVYKYCSSNVTMSDWNQITYIQRIDYGLGRTYCEGSKIDSNINNDMIMIKLRLNKIFQGDFMTGKAINMTEPVKIEPPKEVNTTINGYKYRCTLEE